MRGAPTWLPARQWRGVGAVRDPAGAGILGAGSNPQPRNDTLSSAGESPRSTGVDATKETGRAAGAPSPIERRFEEVIDRYLKETGQENPVSADEEEEAETHGRRRRRSSRRGRTHNSVYDRMRRTVRPSPLLLGLVLGAGLWLVMWLAILGYAIDLDLTKPFAHYTLIRMQKALAMTCVLWVGTSVLLMRAGWRIWRGTLRYREFPPRNPALLRPISIIRGIDAERSGRMCLYVAGGLLLVSSAIVAVTIAAIIW